MRGFEVFPSPLEGEGLRERGQFDMRSTVDQLQPSPSPARRAPSPLKGEGNGAVVIDDGSTDEAPSPLKGEGNAMTTVLCRSRDKSRPQSHPRSRAIRLS
jgi:hypothetical protein